MLNGRLKQILNPQIIFHASKGVTQTSTSESFQLRQIRNVLRQSRDALQQRQAVVVAGGVFVNAEDVKKESRDGGFQFAQSDDEAVSAQNAITELPTPLG